ncbi:phage minor head protein [Chryseobacterium sp. MFBS3-17]|uniref:phage head morphogenesis protein n=1 Tax=Chryseobacterium sp. MFBS3-17 TaxID=2886689 RepID=UPI001D0E6CE6|nr:phage minor head protein [Chryseobacterium sp. MFBS3-17]MCC2590348.1 hypothetical protein [Chryseobacterium sp. MFBS3-17]
MELHKKGSYEPEDLNSAANKKLIKATFDVFDMAIRDNEIPDAMLMKLQNDAFIFSGLKTHAQLMQAGSMLRDAGGNIRSFESFAHEFNKINQDYNQHYLQAEYQFAISSSQSAANWANLDDSDRYNLQYRTAADDRVRDSHAALHNTTLAKDDPFWLSYYPPNGWRCRCVAVEVRKSRYEASDPEKAMQAGEKATSQIDKNGKNKLQIFRFNPGAEQKVFPPAHPYHKLKGAEEVKKELQPEHTPEKIGAYEKKLGVTINKEIFDFLEKETPLTFTNPTVTKGQSGAYYLPDHNIVRIPIDERRKKSKWKAESVVYHEYGHAADWQRDLKKKKAVTDLMDKYRDKLDFKAIDKRLSDMSYWSAGKGHNDLMEKVGAAHDTLMSLNPNYGMGHSKSYWEIEGNKEAEFIAHAFENKFAGNEVFKKVMPELYNDSLKLIDGFKPKK